VAIVKQSAAPVSSPLHHFQAPLAVGRANRGTGGDPPFVAMTIIGPFGVSLKKLHLGMHPKE